MDKLEGVAARVAARRLDGLYKRRGDNDLVIVRVRGPGSQWSAGKLRTLAQLAKQYGIGALHLTTRADVLLPAIPFAHVDAVLSALKEAGMSTRGACGDCLRNITACPGAGVCPNERIDACALATELSDKLAGTSEYEHLPRKFKISISGCERGCALPQIQDVGLVARQVDETGLTGIGFDVYLAGGLGRHPMLAKKVAMVLRPDNVLPFIRATVECFNDLGDRTRRHWARMKFVAEQLGHDGLLAKIKERLTEKACEYVI
ncbi:MAG: nitrite/sulfite reductase [Planctomycetota bacterium]